MSSNGRRFVKAATDDDERHPMWMQMTKPLISFHAADLAGFSRALARQLGAASPSHVSLMNMLARAAGFQNLQHLRAVSIQAEGLPQNIPEALPPKDARKIARALQQFDGQGRLTQWPAKQSIQDLTMWALWAALPAATKMHEGEISGILQDEHAFADAAILRRNLIACGLVSRLPGGIDYQRIEQAPPPEARDLIRAVTQRRKTRVLA